MNTFKLEIISPERIFYSGECLKLVMPIDDGMMGILANHMPFSVALFDGEVSFTKPDGETVVCSVMRGMVDMENNHLQILCESALAPDEIDEQAEKRIMQEAMQELSKKHSQHDFAIWQMTFQHAMNNLKVKGKSSHINL